MDIEHSLLWLMLFVGFLGLVVLGFWFWLFITLPIQIFNFFRRCFSKKPLTSKELAEETLKEFFKQDLQAFMQDSQSQESNESELLTRYARVDYLTEFERQRVRKLLRSGQRPNFD